MRRGGFARANVLGARRQRFELGGQFGNALAQAFAFALDAVAIGDAGMRLRVERVAPRGRGGQIGFDARGDFTRALRFDAPLFTFEFERVEFRAQRFGFGAERRGAGGGRGAHVFVARRSGGDGFAFFAPRRAGAQIREDLEVAHARGYAPVALRAPHLRVELRHAPFELGDQVVHANRVLFGRIEAAHRLGFAR